LNSLLIRRDLVNIKAWYSYGGLSAYVSRSGLLSASDPFD
jgi:hypothetical protein